MSTYPSSSRLPVTVSIHLPSLADDRQPFVYSTQTYIPSVMAPAEAEALLRETVRDGAIAHLIGVLGLGEAQAVAAVSPDTVKIEFASLR